MRIKADLHVHTHISDSSYSVAETVRMAQAEGITHLGIVDHDTTAGLAQAITTGRACGVELITGVEISACDFVRNKRVHILDYNFAASATHIQALCAPLLARRTANSLRHVATLQNAGYDITPEEVKAKAAASTAVSVPKKLSASILTQPLRRSKQTAAGLFWRIRANTTPLRC